MANLVAIAYPDEATAKEVLGVLGRLQTEKNIQIEDAVIVTRNQDGKVKLHQSMKPAAAGAAGGALWGGLIGLLFLAPLLGMAIGAASGGAAGALTDIGVDDKFMKELGANMEPGTAALIVLVHRATPDKVIPEIQPLRRRGHPELAERRAGAGAAGRAAARGDRRGLTRALPRGDPGPWTGAARRRGPPRAAGVGRAGGHGPARGRAPTGRRCTACSKRCACRASSSSRSAACRRRSDPSGGGSRPRHAAEAEVARGAVDRLALPCGGAVAQAVGGRAEV